VQGYLAFCGIYLPTDRAHGLNLLRDWAQVQATYVTPETRDIINHIGWDGLAPGQPVNQDDIRNLYDVLLRAHLIITRNLVNAKARGFAHDRWPLW